MAVLMYIVWIPFQLKRHPGELKIWVLEDCACSEMLATEHNGELMWLVCFLFSFFICVHTAVTYGMQQKKVSIL